MAEKFDVAVANIVGRNGDEELKGGFTGTVRPMGSTNLTEGMLIEIPTDFKVYKNAQLSDETDPDVSKHRIVAYAIAKVLDGNKNVTGAVMVYPSAFNSTLFVYEKLDGGTLRNTGITKVPTGAPVDDFNQKVDIQDAFKAIAGKPILVKQAIPVSTRDFVDRDKLITRKVFEFAYAD